MIKFVALAPGNSEMLGNRALDRGYMSKLSPEFTFFADLTEALKAEAYKCMTVDVFLKDRPTDQALLISYCGWGYWLRKKELIPAICFSLESPIVGWYFFHHLHWIANRFDNLFLWPGSKPRCLSGKAEFHDICWPNLRSSTVNGTSRAERRLIVMINSNKRAFQLNTARISARSPVKSLAWVGYHAYGRIVNKIDPWMKSELYIERLEAIQHFGSCSGFDLFGQGWDKPIPDLEKRLRPFIERCYRGSFPRGEDFKLELLSKYKFSLCFENTSFPGYITEKIFDCFFAGCIPVYLGAPDILNYIPAETFVDYRQFKSHNELSDFLNSMSEQEAQRYLDAAREFMASPLFDKFQSSSLISCMVAALNSVRDQYS